MVAKAKNLVVAQSGGPSPVINNSLRGLVETARDYPQIGTIYAGWHGIEGVLKEELLDLSAQPSEEIALLRVTPAAGSIGTCRYKLRESQREDFERILEVFKAHNVGYFCYIGGNDSMDTANKVAQLAAERGLDLIAVGVPKTIDNDVGDSEFKLIDHTPGYGSTARYWAHAVQFANEENAGSSPADPVLVLQAMGRKIGFIPAAARLADPERRAAAADLSGRAARHAGTNRRQRQRAVAASRSSDCRRERRPADRRLGEREGLLRPHAVQLERTDRRAGRDQRAQRARPAGEGSSPGECARHRSAAQHDLRLDRRSRRGLPRRPKGGRAGRDGDERLHGDDPARAGPDLQRALRQGAAGRGRQQRADVPGQLGSAPDGTDVTDEFVRYARPLIGDDWPSLPLVDGRLRLARLQPLFAGQKLPQYVPQADRK